MGLLQKLYKPLFFGMVLAMTGTNVYASRQNLERDIGKSELRKIPSYFESLNYKISEKDRVLDLIIGIDRGEIRFEYSGSRLLFFGDLSRDAINDRRIKYSRFYQEIEKEADEIGDNDGDASLEELKNYLLIYTKTILKMQNHLVPLDQ